MNVKVTEVVNDKLRRLNKFEPSMNQSHPLVVASCRWISTFESCQMHKRLGGWCNLHWALEHSAEWDVWMNWGGEKNWSIWVGSEWEIFGMRKECIYISGKYVFFVIIRWGEDSSEKSRMILFDGCDFRFWVVNALDESQLPEVFNHQISPTFVMTLSFK